MLPLRGYSFWKFLQQSHNALFLWDSPCSSPAQPVSDKLAKASNRNVYLPVAGVLSLSLLFFLFLFLSRVRGCFENQNMFMASLGHDHQKTTARPPKSTALQPKTSARPPKSRPTTPNYSARPLGCEHQHLSLQETSIITTGLTTTTSHPQAPSHCFW